MTGPHEVDCRELLDSLDLLLDPEIPPERRALLESHLERCKPCLGRYWVEARFVSYVRRCCSVSEAPEHLVVRIRSALRSDAQQGEGESGPGA